MSNSSYNDLVPLIPSEYCKVEELCERDEGDEARGRVVGQHDGDEHERPDQEPQSELQGLT